MEYPKIYLALDNCFALKRWVEPETWLPLIKDLGYTSIQASYDNEFDNKINKLTDFINECNSIVFFGGAGVSTESGIPDFRTPGSGLYYNLEDYDLPEPELLFDLQYFINNPENSFAISS